MMQTLGQELNALCDPMPFHTGWYLKDLRTGDTAHRHGHVVVPSASTRKIAIMMATLKAVHEGKLALEQPVSGHIGGSGFGHDVAHVSPRGSFGMPSPRSAIRFSWISLVPA